MIRPKQAKKILPKSEFEVFETIIDNQHGRMSDARLKQKATVSRKLRDKYRDLARRQTVDAKRKLTNKTDVSQNETRAEIFGELINRIETELERPNRSRPRTADKKAVAKAAKKAKLDRDANRSMVEAKRRARD